MNTTTTGGNYERESKAWNLLCYERRTLTLILLQSSTCQKMFLTSVTSWLRFSSISSKRLCANYQNRLLLMATSTIATCTTKRQTLVILSRTCYRQAGPRNGPLCWVTFCPPRRKPQTPQAQ